MAFERSAGVLLHPTSLPGQHGIGTFGACARAFVDFLAASGQTLWQMCPLGPTGYGNSPYQSFSAFAGNALLIDLDVLVEGGWLAASDLEGAPDFPGERVDYPAAIACKMPLLRKAAANLATCDDALDRLRLDLFGDAHKGWLEDYAFFAALKDHFGGGSWCEWEDGIRRRQPEAMAHYSGELADEIRLQEALQYFFFSQWQKLKQYANDKGVKIIGDIPIFVAADSADAWAHPELFEFDEDFRPIRVAGVPPDYFCATGQLWGNPLYDWERARATKFAWWIERIQACLAMSDIVRIDHFRGFVGCWAVPADHPTAEHGTWEPALGRELFEAVSHELGELPIIAEDLGVITPEVEELRDSNGFPGMKILQFAFDSAEDNDFLPHNYPANSVVYTGTHDNDTSHGWYHGASSKDKQFARDYLDATARNVAWKFIRAAWASTSVMAIAPLQDILGLGNEARTNVP
ncbi:MAG: 4-alpha-glucanotransferase, partial [Verrucomicrobia bacterium]|nr:4-alpha-glucanotransferase [Verrucomicrobiota bacterium]